MANFKLNKIKTTNKKLLRLSGLTSIQNRDLERIKKICQILLKKIKDEIFPKNLTKVVVIDALYTAIFIKYRRCFNSTTRNAGLNKKHIPKKYVKLHEYIINQATKIYAHAFQEQNELAYQVNTETNKIHGISTISKETLYPLNEKYLKELCDLVDGLISNVNKWQDEIKKDNKPMLIGGHNTNFLIKMESKGQRLSGQNN
ncbi:MAG: hypothetical protein KAJ66_03960 [Candidatus Omnitrophica bacterium]|nr:hypothetical protein [Candidatus Omnitrophota bacterium]